MAKNLLTLALFFHTSLFAQILQLSSASAAAGDRIIIQISFKLPNGMEASALQWEITTPAAQLTFLDNETVASPAAQAAGKTVSCARKSSAASDSTAVCMLYGGQAPLRNGVIVSLGFRIAPQAKPGSARIRLSQALAVSRDLKEIRLNDTETLVKIRAK